jgi:hypothetical protein
MTQLVLAVRFRSHLVDTSSRRDVPHGAT